MTDEDVALLKCAEGLVVALEMNTGEQFFAEIAVVVDAPPTPDVFVIRVEREPDGAFLATGPTGESLLLADIRRVALLPWVNYPDTAE